jgi:hypothetical protein
MIHSNFFSLINWPHSNGGFQTRLRLLPDPPLPELNVLPTAAFDVALVIIARHFESLTAIRFTRFDWEYSNLHYWVGNRGSVTVEHEAREPGTSTVRDRHVVTVEYAAAFKMAVA